MRAIRAGALAAKGRAKAQRCDILAENALFIEYVGRCEAPALAVGGGTNDLKRRSDSLEARNTELDDEFNGLSTQIDEQEAMFAEWELSHDQRRVDCKEEHDRLSSSKKEGGTRC
jgi:hypothetical protein